MAVTNPNDIRDVEKNLNSEMIAVVSNQKSED